VAAGRSRIHLEIKRGKRRVRVPQQTFRQSWKITKILAKKKESRRSRIRLKRSSMRKTRSLRSPWGMSTTCIILELIGVLIDGLQSSLFWSIRRRYIIRRAWLVLRKKRDNSLYNSKKKNSTCSMTRIMAWRKEKCKYSWIRPRLRRLSPSISANIGSKHGISQLCRMNIILNVCIFVIFAFPSLFTRMNSRGIQKNVRKGILLGTSFIGIKILRFLRLMALPQKFMLKI